MSLRIQILPRQHLYFLAHKACNVNHQLHIFAIDCGKTPTSQAVRYNLRMSYTPIHSSLYRCHHERKLIGNFEAVLGQHQLTSKSVSCQAVVRYLRKANAEYR